MIFEIHISNVSCRNAPNRSSLHWFVMGPIRVMSSQTVALVPSLLVMTYLLILFLACCAAFNASAIRHTSGGTTVDVSLEFVDGNNSTKFCVEYLSGDDYNRNYDLACFTSFFTDGGTFRDCEVQFDDKQCDECGPCTTDTRQVGYTLNCFNAQPNENTNACVVLDDLNIQQVLVDEEFDGVNLLDINMTDLQIKGSYGGDEVESAAFNDSIMRSLVGLFLLLGMSMY